jgi:hypothetical protein
VSQILLQFRSEDVQDGNSSLVFSHVIFIRNDRRAGFDDRELAGSVVIRISYFIPESLLG